MIKTLLSATSKQFKSSNEALAMFLLLRISTRMKQTPERCDGFNDENLLERKKWKTADTKYFMKQAINNVAVNTFE